MCNCVSLKNSDCKYTNIILSLQIKWQHLTYFKWVVTLTKGFLSYICSRYQLLNRYRRVSSYTDFILTKLQRVKEIEDLDGVTIVSEGIASNYQDIINYAVFGLIKLSGK